ncbi:MAG: zinc ribbon domain-containing protein [Bdellovibrionota bacterium]|jgi:predicted  nucleic acid-binding Zn-ribbon protein
MSTQLTETIKKLLAISKIDSSLAGIAAQKKGLEVQLKEKKEALNSASFDHGKKLSEFESKRDTYAKEEKRLKEQQQKLVDRRKALITLGSYKLQMAAEREIEASAKQLGAQEDLLLKGLESLSELESAANAAQEFYNTVKKDFDEFTKECRATLENMKKRTAEYATEKAALIPDIEARDLETYNRIAQRYPMDPIVPLKQLSCGGCCLELGPQAMVELSRANSLVRCRACGRILYMEEGEE